MKAWRVERGRRHYRCVRTLSNDNSGELVVLCPQQHTTWLAARKHCDTLNALETPSTSPPAA